MNINNIRKQFPILKQKISNNALIYFDNGATTQKPDIVLKEIQKYYKNYNANVHRSINILSEKSTHEYEQARQTIANFINANNANEIIFTRGTTESLNLIVKSFANSVLKKNDIVVLSISEHHSNIVPWLQLQKKINFLIEYIPLNNTGNLDIQKAKDILSLPKVKIISLASVSNALGNINPLTEIFSYASKNVIKIIDGAQSVAHGPTDVQKLGCDFIAFSGHKMYGPTGIGVLWGKSKHLNKMPTWQGGGEMIKDVSIDAFIENDIPYKFEAGTPNICGAIGLGKAVEFIKHIGFEKIKTQEKILAEYLLKKALELNFLKIEGSIKNKEIPLLAFNVKGVHAHDVAEILSEKGIMIRAGHHCTAPLHKTLGIPASARASLTFYNTTAEIDIFIKELLNIYKKFK